MVETSTVVHDHDAEAFIIPFSQGHAAPTKPQASAPLKGGKCEEFHRMIISSVPNCCGFYTLELGICWLF